MRSRSASSPVNRESAGGSGRPFQPGDEVLVVATERLQVPAAVDHVEIGRPVAAATRREVEPGRRVRQSERSTSSSRSCGLIHVAVASGPNPSQDSVRHSRVGPILLGNGVDDHAPLPVPPRDGCARRSWCAPRPAAARPGPSACRRPEGPRDGSRTIPPCACRAKTDPSGRLADVRRWNRSTSAWVWPRPAVVAQGPPAQGRQLTADSWGCWIGMSDEAIGRSLTMVWRDAHPGLRGGGRGPDGATLAPWTGRRAGGDGL